MAQFGKCQAVTKSGQPCTFSAFSASGFCCSHDPAMREELRARARVGGSRSRASTAREESPLRSIDDIRNLVERLTLALENSRGELVPRANAVVKLAAMGLEILKIDAIQKENEELKALLVELRPELKSQLKIVR